MIYCYSDAPKHDQARELERQVQEFLANGGRITTYPPRNVKPKTRKELVALVKATLQECGVIDLDAFEAMNPQKTRLSDVVRQIKADTGWKIQKLTGNVGYRIKGAK